ncbi:MAG: UDP-N-acetylglucosamine--N-acetylmuramyl-(pentapeptide) pyrophosphoryl-undecaprenol N-acetylglucosamine transferase [Elusimicrobiaceae bacterium]|nr:UDP-N-acetylglucosamine--N-acetylmuramyl-(pentapeptide) pyrophosphoryl-undecaprenol N-acetylglucosamine transferase [Elusimicrobiaceae bacterium]
MKNQRFLIASGGTGGHFYPGLSIGRNLQEKGLNVLFLVRKNDLAIETLQKYNLPYEEIDLIGLPRCLNPIRHLQFIGKLIKSLFHTRKIIKAFQPDVAFGTGGYLTFPLIFCARLMGVKTALHDSNSRLGLVNKICGRFVNLFLLGLPIDKTFKNTVLVGTPLRQEFDQPVDKGETLARLGLNPQTPTILVMGGSQGAKGLNKAIVELVKKMPSYQFIHLTGNRWFEILKKEYSSIKNVLPLAYSHEIYALMKSADLTICRSGAGTVAELIACRLPAICVPFPHATEDHQYYNAKILADAGAALISRENENLSEQLQQLLQQPSETWSQMKANYAHVPVPDPLTATVKISQRLQEL